MKKKTLIVLAILGIMILVTACSPKSTTPAVDVINTSIAQTVAVQFTKTAIARPSDTPAPTATQMATRLPVTPVPPTAALGQGTQAAKGTVVVLTPGGQTAGTPAATRATVGGTDKGDWVASDPVDKTTLKRPSQEVTIKIMNTGTSTWTTEYGIEFVSGEQFGLADRVNFPISVPPQMMVDVKLTLTVPSAGPFRSDWKIVNAAGVQIGIFYMEYN
ncbi:MAG TPA: NBR1-Ig-like domain-containing protein [Anaerolineaceae bacterium]|nr:NBR1-Ig-like domain-containing protein [Anaerolineaceae bacterium]